MADPVKSGHHWGKQPQERPSIGIVQENRLARITPRGNVVDCSGKLYSQRSCHATNDIKSNVILQDLTPMSPMSVRLMGQLTVA